MLDETFVKYFEDLEALGDGMGSGGSRGWKETTTRQRFNTNIIFLEREISIFSIRGLRGEISIVLNF